MPTSEDSRLKQITNTHLTYLIATMALCFGAGFAVAVIIWNTLGGGVWRSDVSIAEAWLQSPTELILIVNSCGGHPSVSSLEQSDLDVRLQVVASSTPFRGGCTGFDHIAVRLRDPLGDRVLIDNQTGQVVVVTAGSPSPA